MSININMSVDIIALPKDAQLTAQDALSLPIIEVIDDKTNIAAAENLKIAKKTFKDFESACEPMRLSLREPLDKFLALKKAVADQFFNYERQQSLLIGAYAKRIMDEENARRKETQNQIQIDQSKAKSQFVSTNVKMKPKGIIFDRVSFVLALIESGNSDWINIIFEKYNESELNKLLKAKNIDGVNISFPGVSVEMVPEVRVR